MKIGYFGDGIWAQNALNILLNDKDISISFIVPRYKNPDQKLIDIGKEHYIPIEFTDNINSEEFFSKVSKYDCDLFVSMSFDQIFKKRMINLPPRKTINCHAGKLPFYRGRNILNWVLINDEKEFGITVHYIDEGIDTGDIICQKVFAISDEDTYGTLLYKAHTECGPLLYEAIKMIRSGNVERIDQKSIDSIGMYCGARTKGDEVINWDSTSRSVFNFVRAISDPGPNARSWVNGEEVIIKKIREIKNARPYIGIPGQVIGKTENGFYVKTRDTFVEVVDYESERKLKIGDRLHG